MGDVAGHSTKFHLRNLLMGLQLVAKLFGKLPQCPDINVTKKRDLHDVSLLGLKSNLRLFNVIRKRADATHCLFDVLECLEPGFASDEFDFDGPTSLAGLTLDFSNSIDAANRFFNGT